MNETGPNQTTVYPSVFKLRNQAPVQQAPPPVYNMQPVFNVNRPMRRRGDAFWPPRDSNVQQEQVQEAASVPRRQCKDYSRFFSKHQLPCNYTAYRAPPGTQHVGEDEQGTDM